MQIACLVVSPAQVDHAAWDEETQKWTVTCVDGESYRANFVVSACGMLHIPRLPDVRGKQQVLTYKYMYYMLCLFFSTIH